MQLQFVMEAVVPLQLFLKDSLKNFYIIVAFLFSVGLEAQEAHILFSRVNMGVYNPAFTGTQGSFVSLNSRSQWSDVADAPRTNYLLYYLPKNKNVHLGFTAQNDRVFIEDRTTFTIDYNYEVKISETQKLFLGIKGGAFFNNINLDRLQRLTTVYNPSLAPVSSYYTPLLGVGIQYKTPQYFIGIGVPSLFSSKRFRDNDALMTEATDNPYVHFTGGANFDLNDSFSIEPVVVFRSIPNSPDLFTTTVALTYQEQFTMGSGFSNNQNLAFFFSTQSIRGVTLGYGYEFMNRNDKTAIQGGTHELMIRFMLSSKKEESQRKEGYEKRY